MGEGSSSRRGARALHLGPERRRPQVLDAALALSLERGLRGVSMDAVAKRLGVTRPVIYACFESRERMLGALLAREQRRLFDGVMAALPGLEGLLGSLQPEKIMVGGFQALLRAVSEHADAWRLVFARDLDPAIADRYGDARRRVATRVGKLMAPALRLRGVKDVNRKLPVLVEMFMSLGDGAVRALLDGDGRWTSDELGEYWGRMVLAAFNKA